MRIIEEIKEDQANQFEDMVETFKKRLLNSTDENHAVVISDINGFDMKLEPDKKDKEKYVKITLNLYGALLLTVNHEWEKLPDVLYFLNNAKTSPFVRGPLTKLAFEDSARSVENVEKQKALIPSILPQNK